MYHTLLEFLILVVLCTKGWVILPTLPEAIEKLPAGAPTYLLGISVARHAYGVLVTLVS